jgi:ABC-type bacteriocin/lantibiotic exporter with double-glycine peptidase domain
MNFVLQEDRTGCGLASVAVIANQSYTTVKTVAAQLGISVDDPKLWSDTQHMRKLLKRFGITAGRTEEPFRSSKNLPTRALLAIKWHREKAGPAWHWVVFAREQNGVFVLDSKRGLRTNRRTDFGRIKPKWFIRLDGDET